MEERVFTTNGKSIKIRKEAEKKARRLFNHGAYKFHLEEEMTRLHTEMSAEKDPHTELCLQRQLRLVEKLHRDYIRITDEQLGIKR